ncbi:MAG: Hfq-related RNA-binding protein [Xenococcaceae cyanobacterium]
MSEFNTGLPSVRQIQTLIKDQQEFELKLITDDIIVGKVIWQD